MRWKPTFIACLSFVALSASAQVYRCQDAAGKQTFSDRPCDSGQRGEQLQRKRTPDEVRQERDAAYRAELQKQDRRLVEQERDLSAQQQRARQLQQAPSSRHGGGDWERRNALRNAEVTSSSITNNRGAWDQAAEAQRKAEEDARRRTAAPASPPIFTHCVPGFCYDTQGGVYHRNGPDFMTGPNGQVCHRAGTMWTCS